MKYVIHWFRRDIRLYDNHALHQAISTELPVKCVFIFDENILTQLPNVDKRVQFIYNRLQEIQDILRQHGSDLWVYYGKPIEIWDKLATDENLKQVFTNRDYEPYAINRDKQIYDLLEGKGIKFKAFKDQVIFERNEIMTQSNTPYTVFSPYMKKWKSQFKQNLNKNIQSYKLCLSKSKLYPYDNHKKLSISDIGFTEAEVPKEPISLNGIVIDDYEKIRDIPSADATSKLGTALRFGTVSIREVVKFAESKNEIFLNELIWREFFMQILYNFPFVAKREFREKYEGINWRNNENEFKLWCQGKTGFPIVDAGMRELNKTGFMHNRVRMIVASFLVKDLLIDWRWGEAYFAQKLMDYDLSSNNGNWQWAAGTGTDAAPYFRIFNPMSQQKKFDPDFKYIKKWIPEFGIKDYPSEIVNHKMARERCLAAYKKAIQEFED